MLRVEDRQGNRHPELATNEFWRATMRRSRLDRGMTQGDLANAIGATQPLVSGLEKGTILQSRLVVPICELLEIPLPEDMYRDADELRWIEAGRALRGRNPDQFTALLAAAESMIAHSGERKD